MPLRSMKTGRTLFRRYLLGLVGFAVICLGFANRDLFASFARGGAIGPNGGSVPLLNFAIVGDTRPSKSDDVSGYPTAIIQQIYHSIEASNPHPDFVVTTGDYMYATPGKKRANPQAILYVKAAQEFSGQVFPAIGNHECTGYTKSDCGSDGTNGVTENYTAFMQTIMHGFGINSQLPYYVIHINSSDASNPWTAKFVFVAPNAWDSTQAAWLTKTMEQNTTFTFVVKHEPDYDNSECSGCGASDQILESYPVTLYIYGHTHTYSYTAPNKLVVGNGGAPLDGPSDQYGYVVCRQQSDNSIACSESDYDSNKSSYPNSTVTISATGQRLR